MIAAHLADIGVGVNGVGVSGVRVTLESGSKQSGTRAAAAFPTDENLTLTPFGIDRRFAWGIGIAIGGIALAFGATFLPQREVHYALDVNVFGCRDLAAGRVCTGWARLAVGNTGNVDQSVVRARLPREAANWRLSARVLDVRASAARRPMPVIRDRPEGPDLVYEIAPLPQNTVVEFDGQCFQCPEAVIRALTLDRIQIEASGRVARGDPRVTTLLRGLMNLLLVLVPGS